MTLLATLADTSQRVGATAARLAKIRELAALLTHLAPEEIGIAVHYLAGEMPQGRIGIGPATVRSAAAVEAARVPTLSIAEVERRLAALAASLFPRCRGVGQAEHPVGVAPDPPTDRSPSGSAANYPDPCKSRENRANNRFDAEFCSAHLR